MKRRSIIIRYAVIIVIFISVIIFYSGKLFGLQAANKYNYSVSAGSETFKRTVTVKAMRGRIFDRNGVLLVTNKTTYDISIDKYLVKDSELPKSLYKLIKLLDGCGIEISDRFAVTETEPFKFKDNYFDDYASLFGKYEKDNIGISDYTAQELMDHLIQKYGLDFCDRVTARRIIGQLFEMCAKNYGYGNPFYIAKGLENDALSAVADGVLLIDGVCLGNNSERRILCGDLAAHILGTTGQIFSEDYEKYKDDGYSMDAIVGRSGVEKAFEEYLRGHDGTLVQVINADGNIVDTYYSTVPVPGKDVYLTIDANLQRKVQSYLESTVKYIAANANGAETGEDANAGAAVVQDPYSGEILAIASYPTYDLSTYSADYSEISKRPGEPLINRALNGTYAPGSSFKVLTSIAALEEKIINENSVIYDNGVYRKYAPSYTPACWIYNKYHRTHGAQNVTEALQNSCNYFFFELGERVGIETITKYAKKMGLGTLTGIEVGESSGILAGPEYRNSIEAQWYPGDTLQAAIGQSDNLFTPIQLSNYISTLLNGGTRYQTHLLLNVKDYYYDTVYYQMPANILSRVDLSENTVSVLKNAMRKVVEDGTAATIFNKSKVEISGKTGSAQVSRGSANGIFIGFAPFDKPDIVVSVVIEHGAKGSYAAIAAKSIIEAYYGVDE